MLAGRLLLYERPSLEGNVSFSGRFLFAAATAAGGLIGTAARSRMSSRPVPVVGAASRAPPGGLRPRAPPCLAQPPTSYTTHEGDTPCAE
jgi:hypothetical protein